MLFNGDFGTSGIIGHIQSKLGGWPLQKEHGLLNEVFCLTSVTLSFLSSVELKPTFHVGVICTICQAQFLALSVQYILALFSSFFKKQANLIKTTAATKTVPQRESFVDFLHVV